MPGMKKIRHIKLALGLSAAALMIATLIGCETADITLVTAGRNALRAVSGLQTGTVEVDGHSIAYMERAGDGPTMVLLHGFASEKDVWLRFVRELPRDYRVIALDLPGHGDSSQLADFHYDIPAIVTLVEGAIDNLAEPPLHVAGTSLGGMVATLYTARAPERVRTLALFAPAGVYPPSPSEFQQALDRGENLLIASSPDEFDALVDVVFYDPPPMFWPIGSALRKYAVSRSDFMGKVWSDLWTDHATVDNVLPGIELPVLLVWGKEDRVLDVSSVQVFVALLPDVQTQIVDEAGHAVVNEKPRESARLYEQFLDQRGESE